MPGSPLRLLLTAMALTWGLSSTAAESWQGARTRDGKAQALIVRIQGAPGSWIAMQVAP